MVPWPLPLSVDRDGDDYLLIVGAVALTCSEDDIGQSVPPITDQIHSAQLLRRMQTDLLNNFQFVCDIYV